jgi:photosystem II stability/assembly factor-like uncharacterized protein
MKTFIAISIIVCILIHPTQTLIAQWKQSGGPPGGKVWCFSSAENKVVYAGSDAGFYRSTNGGNRWNRTSLPFQRYWSIATNPGGFVFTGAPGSFYRSTDYGETWNIVYPGPGNPLSIITDGNKRVYIASSTGFYESINNGNTWTRNDSLSGSFGMCFLTFARNGSLFGAQFDNSVYRSNDSGRTWKQVQVGFHIYAIHAGWDSAIYIGTTNGIYRSTDNGFAWDPVNDGLVDTVVQCIHSNSEYLLLAATSGGTYQYNAQLKKWIKCTNGIPDSYALSVYIDNSGKIFSGIYGRGIFQSSDKGATWTASSQGLALSFVRGLACTSTGTLICSDEYTVYRSVDRGYSWIATLSAPVPTTIVVNSHDSVYLGSGNGIYLSSDDGLTWNNIGAAGTDVYWVYVTPRGTVITNNTSGIFRSTNGGATWKMIDSIPKGYTSAIVADKQAILWAAHGKGVYRSDDDGIHWRFTGFTGMYGVFSIGVSSDNSILAGTYGAGMEGYDPTLHRSTDRGLTWTKILERNVNRFCLAKNGWIFNDLPSVHYSTDNGNSWLDYSGGLDASVSDLVSSPEGYIFAGTKGGGVYQTISTFTNVVYFTKNNPSEYLLSQNYPNPFNPVTTISFHLPSKSFISLKIFDAFGREVSTIVSDEMMPGSHTRQWNASSFSSGLYFYRLQAGSFTETKKLLLIK